ncbi:hypothetical protein BC937DRAFT_88815 [Endogone sp. FLAS-F59071]|nr:hypothetical protein BC937DRAFT_88815 [Endogone sp. FLAS-F59071]|eukprot:RUS18394.1 hypothetical protein BC937DRAFT_88815 [Endogone sp. FLAS-F59071]
MSDFQQTPSMTQPLTFPPPSALRSGSYHRPQPSLRQTTQPSPTPAAMTSASYPLRAMQHYTYPATIPMTTALPANERISRADALVSCTINYGAEEGDAITLRASDDEESEKVDDMLSGRPADTRLSSLRRTNVAASNGQVCYYKPEYPQAQPSAGTTSPMATQAMSPPRSPGSPPSTTPITSLYSATDSRTVWSLTEKGWHDMTFSSAHQNHRTVTMSTSAIMFKFQWGDQPFRWEVSASPNSTPATTPPAASPAPSHSSLLPVQPLRPFDLRCYASGKRQLIAEFVDGISQFYLFSLPPSPNSNSSTTEPPLPPSPSPRQQPSIALVDPFLQFLLFSGLVVSDHISSLLASLGGGDDALRLITDPEFSRGALLSDSSGNSTLNGRRGRFGEGEEDGSDFPSQDDDGRYSVAYTDDNESNRLSYSVKSIELRSEWWRCCDWACWWSCCPWFMPGGWCERHVGINCCCCGR